MWPILADGHRQYKIRLYGIACPEKRQAYGQQARQAMTRMAAGREASVRIMDTDRYGRHVGVATVDGLNLNEHMIIQGLAWVYTHYCKADFCQSWKFKEQSAQRAKVGLWRDPDPVPPWDCRRAVRRR